MAAKRHTTILLRNGSQEAYNDFADFNALGPPLDSTGMILPPTRATFSALRTRLERDRSPTLLGLDIGSTFLGVALGFQKQPSSGHKRARGHSSASEHSSGPVLPISERLFPIHPFAVENPFETVKSLRYFEDDENDMYTDSNSKDRDVRKNGFENESEVGNLWRVKPLTVLRLKVPVDGSEQLASLSAIDARKIPDAYPKRGLKKLDSKQQLAMQLKQQQYDAHIEQVPVDMELIRQQLHTLIVKHSVEALVIGLPIHKDAKKLIAARKVRQFVGNKLLMHPLEAIDAIFWDESQSTLAAQRRLHLNKKSGAALREVDATAAAVIVENFIRVMLKIAIPHSPNNGQAHAASATLK